MIPPTGPFGSLQGAFQPKVRKELFVWLLLLRYTGGLSQLGFRFRTWFRFWSNADLSYSLIPRRTIGFFQIYYKEKLFLIRFRYIYIHLKKI